MRSISGSLAGWLHSPHYYFPDFMDDNFRSVILNVMPRIWDQHMLTVRNLCEQFIMKLKFQVLFQRIAGKVGVFLGARQQYKRYVWRRNSVERIFAALLKRLQ